MQDVVLRFLEYVKIDTGSVERVDGVDPIHPSSPGQTALINKLADELDKMGVSAEQIKMLGDGSMLVNFPPHRGFEGSAHAVFVAHVDTSPECAGGANPLVRQYTGGDIALPTNNKVIPASDLAGLEGKTIITSDGSTLLGADDKAGVASLMVLIQMMLTNNLPHGEITFWFCVDEEIGEVGTDFLPEDIAKGWSVLWTVDGSELNLVDIGCFYGTSIKVEFNGRGGHPGEGGAEIKPAHYAASRFISGLGDVNDALKPWTSKGQESFVYVPTLPKGTAEQTTVNVIPRTFRQEEVPELAGIIKRVAEDAADHYGVQVVVGETKVTYVSNEVAISANRRMLEVGLSALKDFGITPQEQYVRGGTDGAMFNVKYPKIPAPNLGNGGRNFHKPTEFLVMEELAAVPHILVNMVARFADMPR